MSVPQPPKGSGLSRRLAATLLLPGHCWRAAARMMNCTAKHFNLKLSSVLHGNRMSLITPQILLLAWEPWVKTSGSTNASVLQGSAAKQKQAGTADGRQVPKKSLYRGALSTCLFASLISTTNIRKPQNTIIVNKASWEGDTLSSFSLLLSLCIWANLAVSQDLQF